MKTILVPTDFSPQAENAIDLAIQIAKHAQDVKIKILHVIESETGVAFSDTADAGFVNMEHQLFMAQYLEKREKKLKEDMFSLAAQDRFVGLEVGTDIEVGNPFQSISKAIANHQADLLIMGTQGASGMEEVLIGSNTEKVVRNANCPVITLKQHVNIDDIKDIVVATDLKDDHSVMIGELQKLQKFTGAKLHFLKVNTPNHFHTNRFVNGEFAKFEEKYKLTNYTVNIYNDATEEDGVIYFAEDIGASMIALGTHGRTGLLHLLSGSIAEDLVNHSKIPVWTLSLKK
jgi:nucleotide-binding universal stress UspA family protein